MFDHPCGMLLKIKRFSDIKNLSGYTIGGIIKAQVKKKITNQEDFFQFNNRSQKVSTNR